jgi:hypothetical protein
VLTVSLLLSANSGRVPIASFCVEQGRWSPRGREDAGRFAAAPAMAPSREAKLAMNAGPRVAAPPPPQQPATGSRVQIRGDQRGSEISQRQQAVWASVARTQAKLSGNLGKDVKAQASATSLQLALENETLKAAQAAYIAALRGAGERASDIVGYVFAINGKLNSGDVYGSNALFRKLWPKLLDAAATESIGEKDAPRGPAPSVAEVQAFLAAAESGPARAQAIPADGVAESRDNDRALFVETRRAREGFVHRSYVAK